MVNSSCLGYQSLTAHCSLIGAAVTGACITHLSKSASPPPTPFSAESQQHSHTARIFTRSQTPLQDARAGKCAGKADRRACAHAHRRRSHYGDKSCLSWPPSVSHGVVRCTSQTPPSSAFHRWICGASAGASSGGRDRGTVLYSDLPLDGEQTRSSRAFRFRGAQLWKGGGQVNHRGLTKFNPLKREFTPALLGRLNRHADPIFSVYISVLSPRLLFALIMGLAPVTPI